MFKIEEDSQKLGQTAAVIIARQLIKKPNSVIALPTGVTPIPMYKAFVELMKYGIVPVEDAHFFNLDEYVGLTKNDPMSFAYYMDKHFLSKIGVIKHEIPLTNAKDPEKEAQNYEGKIKALGGFDLCFLGIGIDGHIGFNEPGTPFSSITHVAKLQPSTIKRNSKEFGKEVPNLAITVGIKTIMHSRHIVLMATGTEKSDILNKTLFGEVTTSVPASVLQLHPNLTILVDEECAKGITTTNARSFR